MRLLRSQGLVLSIAVLTAGGVSACGGSGSAACKDCSDAGAMQWPWPDIDDDLDRSPEDARCERMWREMAERWRRHEYVDSQQYFALCSGI
jgi:hypothetical protein